MPQVSQNLAADFAPPQDFTIIVLYYWFIILYFKHLNIIWNYTDIFQ